MANQHDKKEPHDPKNDTLKPEPETLHTTDPQEHMRGPVSSTMKGIEKEAEKGDAESKREADERKEKNI